MEQGIDVRRMSHTNDPDTSHAAAVKASRGRKREQIQDAIVHLLQKFGPAPAKAINAAYQIGRLSHGWPEADLYDIRRRLTEVQQAGRAFDTGVRHDGQRIMAATQTAVIV